MPSPTESGYGQLYTKMHETKISYEKTLRDESKPKLFQNYQSELDEEEKSNGMFFQQQYLDLDRLIQKTIKVAPPK